MEKILIYGAGQNGIAVLEQLDTKRTKVIGWVDKDGKRKNSLLEGKPVYMLDMLQERKLQYDKIIISNYSYWTIRQELIYHFSINSNRIIAYYEYPFTEDRENLFQGQEWKIKVLEYELLCCHRKLNNVPYEMVDKILANKIRIPIVKDAHETIRQIMDEKKSICRFGDGELTLVANYCETIGTFQKSSEEMQKRLREIVSSKQENILIGIHNGFGSLEHYEKHYQNILRKQVLYSLRREDIYPYLDMDKIYYDAYFTRPWSTTYDVLYAESMFSKMRLIWKDKRVVMIEGSQTRFGIGNRLLEGAIEIERIICPSCNAFQKYSEILEEAKKIEKDKLILIALGPTATILTYDLALSGYQAIDIGHADIEYEWFCRRCYSKEPVPYKYVNEASRFGGICVEELDDAAYKNQIIARIE